MGPGGGLVTLTVGMSGVESTDEGLAGAASNYSELLRQDACRVAHSTTHNILLRTDAMAADLKSLVSSADADSLWNALCAWATRPSTSNPAAETHQRLVARAAEFLDATGRRRVDKSLLRHLLAALPKSQATDSDLLLNPDLERGFELRGERLLVHPGSHDRPLRDLAELFRAAAVADPVLDSASGFGISDLIELQLRHGDAVLRTVLPLADLKLREPAASEIEAYASVPSMSELTATCARPVAALKALEWATMPAPIRVATMFYDGNSSCALRVVTPTGTRDLPPPVAFDTGTACGQSLLSRAVELEGLALSRYQRAVANEAFAILGQVAKVDRLAVDHALVSFDQRRVLDVVVAANVNARALSRDVERLEASRRPRGSVIGLVVVAQPSYMEYVHFGLQHRSMMGVDDLTLICLGGRRTEDLFLFLESTSNGRLGQIRSWDMLDQYSCWVDAGELPHGRQDLTAYDATGCRIEWDRAAGAVPTLQHRAFPHRSMRARAEQQIFWELEEEQGNRELVGEAAQALLRDKVVPAAGTVVDRLIARYNRDDLLSLACSQVDFIEECRHAESVAWTATDIDVVGRAARILVEKLVAANHTSGDSPELLDWQELLAASECWIEAATLTSIVGRQLEVVNLRMLENGEYRVAERSRGLVDLDAYAVARAESAGEDGGLTIRALPLLDGHSSIVRQEPSASGGWNAVLYGYYEHFGTSLEAIVHVLLRLGESTFGVASVEELQRYCLIAWSGPSSDIAQAVQVLILRATELRSEGVLPWRAQERAHRLASHPLPEVHADTVAVMPAWIRGATFILLRYLSEGRLPHPTRTLGGQLEKALSAYRNELTREIEREVTAVLSAHSLPFLANVKAPQTLGLPALSGEIDHICAVEATRTLWVLEEKDPVENHSVDSIRRSLARFVDPQGYGYKLKQKVASVSADSTAAAEAIGASPLIRWHVRGAFVTRRPIPAGFAGIDFPFATPQTVVMLLTSARHPRSARKGRQ